MMLPQKVEIQFDTGQRLCYVELEEYPDRIIFHLKLSRYGNFDDLPIIRAKLEPLLMKYEGDGRPMILRDQQSGQSAIIFDSGIAFISTPSN